MQKTMSQQIDYHVAWRLTQLREAREVSREQLAVLIDIPAQEIYRFEAAHVALNAREIAIFAAGLGVTPNEFFAQFDAIDSAPRMLEAVPSTELGMNTIELVRNFLKISCAKSRHSLGLAARRAGRHY